MTDLVIKAARFAQEAHDGQTRKYTGEPYFAHCHAVASLVSERTDDVEVIAAAYLHDTLEDTETTYSDIAAEFGERVAYYVWWLTDLCPETTLVVFSPSPKCSRWARKKADADRMATAPDEVKLIKQMDIADNTKDIVKHDPGFAKTYLKEKAYLLQRMGF